MKWNNRKCWVLDQTKCYKNNDKQKEKRIWFEEQIRLKHLPFESLGKQSSKRHASNAILLHVGSYTNTDGVQAAWLTCTLLFPYTSVSLVCSLTWSAPT